MVTGNIVYLLRNFLRCSAYETVIFGWVMHQREIIDGLLEQLQDLHCKWGAFCRCDRTQCRAFAPL